MSYMPRDLASHFHATERKRGKGRGACRRETNYFPRQHASMLFTAHNELFELSLRRENTKCRTLPSSRSLQPPCRYFSPALRYRNAPRYFCPREFSQSSILATSGRRVEGRDCISFKNNSSWKLLIDWKKSKIWKFLVRWKFISTSVESTSSNIM